MKEHIIALLKLERERITKAIEALEGTPIVTGTRTPEQRQRQAEKMREYWAKMKAGNGGHR